MTVPREVITRDSLGARENGCIQTMGEGGLTTRAGVVTHTNAQRWRTLRRVGATEGIRERGLGEGRIGQLVKGDGLGPSIPISMETLARANPTVTPDKRVFFFK